jgi:putative FmdB family regulatory protein
MPTYDYKCDACGHAFEEWQSFTAEKLTKCPTCKKNKLVRLFGSGAAIVFKGSGFYDTDYRQADEKKKSERAGVKPPTDAPAETPAETKAEAKPDAPAKDAPKEATPAAKPEPKAAKESKPAAKPKAAKE